MASHGINDQVAIVGMGCTRFGEHWDKGADDLLIDASEEAFASAGVTKDDVDAYWFGTAMSGMSGMALARPLQLQNKPVSRVENFCATGSEALRNAAYAVASGAYDTAMAIGVEKVKDSGYQGLVGAGKTPTDGTTRTLTAAAMFAMCVPAYAKKYGVDPDEMREVLAHISAKNHYNGARNPRAQFRREVSTETICNSPLMAGDLRVFDCSGVADGSAAAVVVLAGTFDLHGEIPVNPDGGLKSFGHPVGASGLRMMFEAWLQLRHQAPEERQITTDRTLGLTHNLGGYPGEMVSFV